MRVFEKSLQDEKNYSLKLQNKFFGKIKNVRLADTSIKNKKVDDIEIDECITATFTFYGKKDLRCKIISISKEESEEGESIYFLNNIFSKNLGDYG